MVKSHEESEPLMSNEERNDNEASSASDNTNNDVAQRRRDATSDAAKPPKTATTTTTTSLASLAEGDADQVDAGHPDAPLEDGIRDGRAHLEVEDESDPPTPRFYQDEHNWKRWKWVPYPVRRVLKAVQKWSRGPPNPHPYKIKPFFPAVQEYPLFLVERFIPLRKHRIWLLCLYFIVWLLTFVFVKRAGVVSVKIEGWGEPQQIDCGTTYWGKGNSCGFEGDDCRPFTDSGFAFRCSADCQSYNILNPRAVGDQEINYSTFVIGGPDVSGNATYRGDSFVCQAAIHAGIVNNGQGGCGVVELVGKYSNYASSNGNGIKSIGFDSYFPQSFRFVPDIDCRSNDMRWSLLAVSTVFTAVLSLFTSSAALFFFANFVMMFWTVGMAMDPPSTGSVATLFSNVLGKFLPAMFVAWVMYDKMGVRRTLHGLTAQFEKTILWLGPCWVGALTNYTLDFIPIQRLTGHDLEQQPGAKAALAFIVIILAIIVATQVWFFRQEARFIKYIKLYALFIGGIIIALVLPGLNLRIHHYILALLLLPGTSMQTRPSLVYQGLLIGLFINGIARWGFDAVLQTPGALQGDAQLGTGIPTINTPVIHWSNTTNIQNITFTWEKPGPDMLHFDGLSVLVNDVERFRTYFDDDITTQTEFLWTRNTTAVDTNEYFRFGFMQGADSGDYTQAGTWTADGEWKKMKPGPSKRGVESADYKLLSRKRR